VKKTEPGKTFARGIIEIYSSISVPEKEPPPKITVTLKETIEALSNLFKLAAKASQHPHS
jgi:hypothetical protein